MEDVGIFYGYLIYFTLIWYILCPFIWYIYFRVIWYIFPRYGMLHQENLATRATIEISPTDKRWPVLQNPITLRELSLK
jgi:hypothetical protein